MQLVIISCHDSFTLHNLKAAQRVLPVRILSKNEMVNDKNNKTGTSKLSSCWFISVGLKHHTRLSKKIVCSDGE